MKKSMNLLNGTVSNGSFKNETDKEVCNAEILCMKKQKDRKISEI